MREVEVVVAATFPMRNKDNKLKSRACNVWEEIWGDAVEATGKISSEHGTKVDAKQYGIRSIPKVRDGEAPTLGIAMVANTGPESRVLRI